MNIDYQTFNNLMKGIYYRINHKHFQHICKTGIIKPNEFGYYHVGTQHSVAYINKWIPLFDFKSAGEQRSKEVQHDWKPFFSNFDPTIILQLDPRALPNIIPNPDIKKSKHLPTKPTAMYIASVEAFYPEPIPIAAIIGCYIARKNEIPNFYSVETAIEIINKEFGNI